MGWPVTWGRPINCRSISMDVAKNKRMPPLQWWPTGSRAMPLLLLEVWGNLGFVRVAIETAVWHLFQHLFLLKLLWLFSHLKTRKCIALSWWQFSPIKNTAPRKEKRSAYSCSWDGINLSDEMTKWVEMSKEEAAKTGCYSATAAGHRCYMVLQSTCGRDCKLSWKSWPCGCGQQHNKTALPTSSSFITSDIFHEGLKRFFPFPHP